MATKKKIRILVERHGYKKQPFTFTVNESGPRKPQQHDQRYSTRSNARRGALLEVGAAQRPSKGSHPVFAHPYHRHSDGAPIEFTFVDNRKKK